MLIALITDAWYPQINGVVTTWNQVREELIARDHTVDVIHPGLFRTIAAPKYPEIRLAIYPRRGMRRMLDRLRPDAVHIATEGSLGLAARGWCRSRRVRFTTSYHTRFPQYLQTYFEIPPAMTYRFLRWFHGPATRTLVTTPSMRDDLSAHGFDPDKLIVWTRGVCLDRFTVRQAGAERSAAPGSSALNDLPHPRFLFVGRVAPEKNIEAFLKLDLPGSKVVVGDGPLLPKLREKFPQVIFTGFKTGDDLASHVSACDVFVFPSLTDTFGVVMLEAMACGLPVAAFPVIGPIDVVGPQQGVAGFLDNDLRAACLKCLDLDRAKVRTYAEQFTWDRCADMVLANLAINPAPGTQPGVPASAGMV
ncbi:MAG: glycosyltransferase family 1 protein [Phycisphaeraceae bacterium]